MSEKDKSKAIPEQKKNLEGGKSKVSNSSRRTPFPHKKKRKSTSQKKQNLLREIGNLLMREMKKDTEKSYNYKQLATAIGYTDPRQRELVIQALHRLRAEDQILEEEKGRYTIHIEVNETLTGRIDFNQGGNAYVIVEGLDEDIFIHHKNVKDAMQGDTVLVVTYKFKGKKLEGSVLEVVHRNKNNYVGVLEISHKGHGFVILSAKKMNTDIFIPANKLGEAKDGDKVVVRMIQWNPSDKNPEGEIIQILGRPGENDTEIHAILADYELPYAFPEEVEEEAKNLDKTIGGEELNKRRDMRDILTFTIDPKDAKDFDDALSIRELSNGNWEIGVHIADVSHYVQPGTLLDTEAYQRATSVYLVDRVVPMLPEILSNEVCSLRPNEDKYTFSAVFEMDKEANIVREWFGRTVIHSVRRFTYEEAQERIETGKGDLAKEILILNDLAKILRQERLRAGAIAFDKTEIRFNLDEKANPIGVYFKVGKEANHLIEEFMLLANKSVSRFVSTKNGGKSPSGKTFIYRIHDDPDPTKIASMKEFVQTFGYKMNTGNRQETSDSINKLLKKVKGTPEENMIETLAMRSMSKAVYSTENIGHYGLAFDYYSHFTSPIRRYPDLMAHRLLQHYLDGGKSPDPTAYEEQAKHCSAREKIAADAERDSIKYMQVKFMQDKVGQVFEGVVSGVQDYGIFVQIPENGSEGLIRLRDLVDDSYTFDPKIHAVVGRRTGNMYQLGSPVKIKVVKANLVAKQLDFKIIKDQKD